MQIDNRHTVQTDFPLPPGMIAGYSTNDWGDMRKPQDRERFLQEFGVGPDSLVWQEQVHGVRVHAVVDANRGQTVRGVDALVAGKPSSGLPLVLSVHTADCVPVLLFDPVNQVIGAAHSGWRGTLGHITSASIASMAALGANIADIRVIIGPHIGSCCYAVAKDRIDAFAAEFPDSPDVCVMRDSRWYLDLGSAIRHDCLKAGIRGEHIEGAEALCTGHTDRFYSFRRTGPPLIGELIGIIGFSA